MAEHKPLGSSIVREIAGDGSILIRDDRCTCQFRRLCTGAMEIRIVGTDSGQFGTAVIDEVAWALFREGSLELLVDAADGSIMSVAVTTGWARFFELNRRNLVRVTILAGSKATTVAMGLVRYLSKTGDLISIHSDRAAYEARKSKVRLEHADD